MPTLIGEGRSGDVGIRLNQGVPVVEMTVTYRVLADTADQDRSIVITTPGLPTAGQTIREGLCVCKSLSASRNASNPRLWEITTEFSSEDQEGQDNQDPTSDPETWVPEYETKFERVDEVVTEDVNGVTVANSAGTAFPQGLTVTRLIPVWEFVQVESASITDEDVLARNEVVNSTTFKGRAAKTLLCVVVNSYIGRLYGKRRRLTIYHLKYNERDWKHKRRDIGPVHLVGGAEVRFDKDGGPPIGGLDGSTGAKVTVGDPPGIIEFDIYNTSDFSFLRT